MARAKPDLRELAVDLRLEGRSYREIATVVPVAKSTLSLWLRDVPLTDEHRAHAYVGCLVVHVRRSTDLNRRIAGWWQGIAAGLDRPIGTMIPPSGVV